MPAVYEHSDASVVVVIGSGAGGGTLANELAQKGIGVVCLEAGNRLALTDIENDPGLMNERIGWNDSRIGPAVWLCKTVGGTTVRWSGITPRIQAHELRPRSTYGLLEDTTLIDWPVTLEELEPWYDEAEDRLGVTGTHGIPPSFETANFKVLRAGGRRIGYREITATRTAINPVARDGRPACQQIGFCHSGCRIGAKWSTLYSEIPKAEATDRFELRANSMALQITHDASGRVRGVVYVDGAGAMHEQRARAVAVAGNVIESTRLLLNSASAMFPDGLGNASGHLGRNYMRHVSSSITAVMPGEVNYHKGPRQAGLIFDEQYHRPERGFAGGYLIETSASHPGSVSDGLTDWGRAAAARMESYPHLAGVFITGEDPPQAANRITLHPSARDQYGLAVPVIEYEMHANSWAMQQHAIERTTELYESLGGTDVQGSVGIFGTCHNMGTARM
ncbi:MAG TPA: GMC family oxidoreductase, partial [Gammaproteobacteria bacterium]|nr:GMC family oxidoreductase [Gammaproteobacteria bacterium]